jgi:predicted permease
VALALVLLAAAGLFIRTLQNLRSFDPGFQTDGVLVADLDDKAAALPVDFVDRLEGLPGIAAVAFSTHTPLSGAIWSEPAVPAGQPLPDKDTAFFVGADSGFFDTMRIGLIAGRTFTRRDVAGGPLVAVVNEAFAVRYFGGRNPVGERLTAKIRGVRNDLEIVGFVENTSAAGLREPPPPTVYVAFAQLTGDGPAWLSVRVTGSLANAESAIRKAIGASLPNAAIEVRPLRAQVEATIAHDRMVATLAGAFGLLALALACVGLYGLLAYGVAQRTREIGIRMALGAQASRVILLVQGRAVRLVLAGIALGLPAAWMASRAIRSMLFGLTPADPWVMGAAIALLIGAAQVATYLPARRAARVDPLTALRHE